MNTNWAKILLFSLLSFVLGFILSCLVCPPCMGGGCGRDMGGCQRQMSCCDADGHCEHGGSCCKAGGQCDKSDCDHAARMMGHGGGACCGMSGGKHGGGEGHHDRHVRTIVKDLEESGFQGDTTMPIPGGTVNVLMMGDSTKVLVNMEKEVVAH